jgi:hypothetical protein
MPSKEYVFSVAAYFLKMQFFPILLDAYFLNPFTYYDDYLSFPFPGTSLLSPLKPSGNYMSQLS